VTHDSRVKLRALLVAALVAAVVAAQARANGDPASDVLPFTTVFLSAQQPNSSQSGRDLVFLTKDAAKKKFPIRVAVIYQPSDLGLIQSLWKRPQPYANFLGKELISFGRYHGTLVVGMPNGFGVFGPGATAKGKAALEALPKPGNGSLDDLGEATVAAVRKVTTANGHPLAAPPAHDGGGTPTWLIVLAVLAGVALLAGALFYGLRRWLTSP
jgi:hypothetical protein